MQKQLFVAAMGLMLVGIAMPASAHNITGDHVDEAASLAVCLTNRAPADLADCADPVNQGMGNDTDGPVVSSNWWAGNTVIINDPSGGIVSGEVNDQVDALCILLADPVVQMIPVVPDLLITLLGCGDPFVTDPIFTQGVVLCETNDAETLADVGRSDANAGWGGRCDSSNATDTSGYVYKIFDFTTMTVAAHGNCGAGTAPAYFARLGNNANGLEVASGDDFHYRQLAAEWIDAGHVTYFINADWLSANSANPLGCFGSDSHDESNDDTDHVNDEDDVEAIGVTCNRVVAGGTSTTIESDTTVCTG